MKAGTLIKLADGRQGVVVYHGLDGHGIKVGKLSLSNDELDAIMSANPLFGEERSFLEPDVMLRTPYSSATCECIPDYEVVS